MDTVQTRSKGFTAVPHVLLRQTHLFTDPLDFMIYLHLFTYSYGFGRATADMSQGQLERFTGVSKNTIKRSLERLSREGWIKLAHEYEHARISRKWWVKPVPSGEPGGGKRRGSTPDTEQNSQSESRRLEGSDLNPPTGSKADTYKQSVLKQKSHSQPRGPQGAELQAYFAAIETRRKAASEAAAFAELRSRYAEEEIALAVRWLQEHGSPGKAPTPVHSPMAFLAKVGLVGVLDRARASEAEDARRKQAQDQKHQQEQVTSLQAHREEQRAAQLRAAFAEAFPDAGTQDAYCALVARSYPGMDPRGPLIQAIAIERWATEKGMAAG